MQDLFGGAIERKKLGRSPPVHCLRVTAMASKPMGSRSVLTTGFHASTKARQRKREAERQVGRNTLGRLPAGFSLAMPVPVAREPPVSSALQLALQLDSAAAAASLDAERQRSRHQFAISARSTASSAADELPSVRSDVCEDGLGSMHSMLLHVAALRAYVAPRESAIGVTAAQPHAVLDVDSPPHAPAPAAEAVARAAPLPEQQRRISTTKAARRLLRRPRSRPGAASAPPVLSHQDSAHKHGPVHSEQASGSALHTARATSVDDFDASGRHTTLSPGRSAYSRPQLRLSTSIIDFKSGHGDTVK